MDSLINFSVVAPNLHALSQVKTQMAAVKPQQIRFLDVHDRELVHLLELLGGNTSLLWSRLKDVYGDKFTKRCRDRYNIYVNKHKFSKEEDQCILEKYYMGWKPNPIGKVLNIPSRQVAFRIKKLLRDHQIEGLKNPEIQDTIPVVIDKPPVPEPTHNETEKSNDGQEPNIFDLVEKLDPFFDLSSGLNSPWHNPSDDKEYGPSF